MAARVSSSCEHGCFDSNQASTKGDADPKAVSRSPARMAALERRWRKLRSARERDLAGSGTPDEHIGSGLDEEKVPQSHDQER
jgi:hypothetical protein